MLGKAAIAMWWDIAPEMQPAWEDWHTHEHFPERLAIPGFLRGSRWKSGRSSYFVLYEARDLKTITGGPYLKHLNRPTPWSRRMMPHHLNMVRSLCRVRASFGGGLSRFLVSIRFSGEFSGLERLIRKLPERKGLTGAHLLVSQRMSGKPTTEQKIRGGDAVADRILIVTGHDLEAVRKVDLVEDEKDIYTLSHSLVSKEWQ